MHTNRPKNQTAAVMRRICIGKKEFGGSATIWENAF